MNTDVPTPAPRTTPPPPPAAAGLGWHHRLVALAVFVPSLAVLLTAANLRADPRGIGTHTQLGLAPCGFEAATGLPCATCGMTTSFTLAADGRLGSAFVVQPAGTVLAVLTAMAVLVSGWALATGMPLGPVGRALGRPAVVVAALAVLLGGWAFTAGRAAWGG